jgi:peptidoglycan LD-endopeptidase LytH
LFGEGDFSMLRLFTAISTVLILVISISSQAVPASAASTGSSTGSDQPTGTFVYVFPVQPSVTSYGPYHHDYPATDIFCPIGSKFVAPTGGVVDYISTLDRWDPKVDDPATRGGLSVAIIGDDGVRYYGSHLSAVEQGIVPGVRVQAGQLLGLTGKTGDARYVAPHLHFGISHPTTPDDWKTRRGEISPYKYLRAWQAHTPLTPQLPSSAPAPPASAPIGTPVTGGFGAGLTPHTL